MAGSEWRRLEGASRGGWRWVAAGVILLTLGLVSRTDAGWARPTLRLTRYWATHSFAMPRHWEVPLSHLVSRLERSSPTKKPHDAAAWQPPVAAAKLQRTFGWHGRGAHAVFDPDVVLRVARKAPVLAGASGRVVAIRASWVEWRVGDYLLRVSPVYPRVHEDQPVVARTVLGFAESRRLKVQVTAHGLPVNPLSASLYGTGWLSD
ncbi:MAG: hypothetical protein OWU84_09150 [Firmicutes bacterium]|nr:hypothetical protein [Bacillota bacterium]